MCLAFQRARINKEELLLGLESQTSDFILQELTVKKEPFDKLWNNAVYFHQQHEKWMSGPLLQVNAEEVEEEVGHLKLEQPSLLLRLMIEFESSMNFVV